MLHLVYAVVGTAGVVLALFSRPIRQLPFSDPLVALVLGVLIGPQVLGMVEIPHGIRDPLLLEMSRLLLAGSVMAAALRFPATELRPLVRPVALLLIVVMPLAALITGAAGLLLGLPLGVAFLVGTCLAPTDPVLASSVVSGEPAERDLPSRVRQLLSVESGANDGLGLLFVGLLVAVVLPADGPGDALGRLLLEVGGGVVLGVIAGILAGRGIELATRHRELAEGPALVFTLLLAVAVLGLARTLSLDGVLAVFVAGVAYNRAVASAERSPQFNIDEAVNRYATLPMFVVLGAVLPWSAWAAFGPAAFGFAAAVLLLRRPPLLLLLARALGLRLREATFLGWFGPMGVSAVFYLAHSSDKGVTDPNLFAAVTLAVSVSVVAFGVTASPGRKLYASRRG